MSPRAMPAGARKFHSEPGWVLMRITVITAAVAMSIVGVAVGEPAQAALKKMHTEIPAQGLAPALRTLAKERNFQIVYASQDVASLRTRGAVGEYTAEDALSQILSGTGLAYRYLDDHTVTIFPVASAPAQEKKDVPKATAPPTGDDGKARGSFLDRFRLAQATSGNVSGRAAVEESGQRSAETSSAQLEEVVVTAQKRSQNILDVPLSVTALSAQALQRAGIDTVLSLSYSVPSLVVQPTGGGFQRYFIRGVGNGNSTTSLVGIYLDEADVTTNGNSQLNLRAIDLERVEVLKGPQGTLYGAGSAGGTIRFITRDPDLQNVSGLADAQGYSTRYGTPSEEIYGVLNLPLISDTLGVRVVGTYANLGGWVDQPAAGRTNINDQDLRDVRVKALWKPNDDMWWKALVDINRNRGHGSEASADPSYDLSVAVDPAAPTPFKSEYDVYNLTGSYTFGGVNLLSSSTYFDTFTRAVIGLSYPVAPAPEPLFDFLNDPDTRITHGFSQELRVSSVGTSPFHWLAGAFYKELTIDYTTAFEYGTSGDEQGSGVSVSNETSKSTSLFVDGGYNISPAWEVGGGLRYFHDDRTTFDTVQRMSGGFHNLAPRIYTSYALSDDMHVYASAADGFRSGGFNAGDDIPQSSYAPEKVRSYELGTKASLLDHAVSAELALFFSRYQNIQYFIPTPNGIGMLNNAGTAHVRGVDWSVDWQANRNLLLSLNGNVTRSRIVSLLPDVGTVLVGDPVDYATDYSARVAATYGWNLTESLPAFAHIEFARVGPSHMTDRGEGGPPILFTTDTINMLNARFGLSRGAWTVELFGDNLANANGIQDASGAFGFGTRPRPRTVGIEVRAAFQ
ncbi:MAG: TonB-dependent receptor [Gammaproteobacteria bacterium]